MSSTVVDVSSSPSRSARVWVSTLPARASVALAVVCAMVAGALLGGASANGAPVHNPRLRTFDVQHIAYALKFDLDKHEVHGHVTHTIAPLQRGFTTVRLDAADMAFTSLQLRHANGKTEALKFDYNKDLEALTIELPRAYDKGESFDIAIDYVARPTSGCYFLTPADHSNTRELTQIYTQGETHDNHHWLPMYDAPNDFATTEATLTVPVPLVAVANGDFLGVTENGRNGEPHATRTYRYRLDIPHAAYLVSFVVGDMVTKTYEWQRGPNDVVPCTCWVFPDEAGMIDNSFGRTTDMLGDFSTITGTPYPWPKYDQVSIERFRFGGMENVTLTNVTSRTMHDDRAHLDWSSDWLVAHELAHQWFGDLVTCENWSDLWLNEGFATWFEHYWSECDRGADGYVWSLQNGIGRATRSDDRGDVRPMRCATYNSTWEMFDGRSYAKGGWVVHMLRRIVGDEVFTAALKKYLADNAHTPVHTRDLRTAFEQVSGQRLDWFFDQYVHKAGFPKLDVSWDWVKEDRMLYLTVNQTQQTSEQWPLFNLPVEFEIAPAARNAANEPAMHTLRVRKASQTFVVPCPYEPLRVRVDPRECWLKHLNLHQSREAWIDQIDDSSIAMRRMAIGEYGSRAGGDGAVRDRLFAVLESDAFVELRAQAAEVLADNCRGNNGVAERLLAVFHNSDPVKDASVRSAIAERLHHFPRFSPAIELARHLANDAADRSYRVEAGAIRALAHLRHPDADAICREALARESYYATLYRAGLEGLAEIGAPDVYQIAFELAQEGVDDSRRDAALDLVLKAFPDDPQLLPFVYDMLNDGNFRVRSRAARMLEEVPTEETLKRLEARLEVERDGGVLWPLRSTIEAVRAIVKPDEDK